MLGGITEHVHGQARELARRGHEVTVVTGPPAAHAADRRPGRAAGRRRGLRGRARGRRRPALRQRLADDPHRARRASSCSCAGCSSAWTSTSCTCTRPTTRACARSRRWPSRAARSASRPTTPSSPRACCSTCSRPILRRWLGRLDAHVVVSEACIGSLAPVLPVRLPHHPERHRRPALLARRRAAARVARGRQAPDPVPRPLRPAQRTADDARGVSAGTCGARGIGAAVRRRRRAARQRLPPQAPRARGGRRDLGRARRLVAPALLRVGRHPLHALPARLLRDGAAGGHEHRAPGRGQPHLGLPAAHGARQAGADGEPGRRRQPLRPGAPVPARPARRARAHGPRGAHHGRHALRLVERRGAARAALRRAARRASGARDEEARGRPALRRRLGPDDRGRRGGRGRRRHGARGLGRLGVLRPRLPARPDLGLGLVHAQLAALRQGA